MIKKHISNHGTPPEHSGIVDGTRVLGGGGIIIPFPNVLFWKSIILKNTKN
jgi:hypothetical protein